ncbi:MAG: NAD-dependent epimerase/dehydratase family protein [Candidatus Dormibacteraeota bacterium]|uniref:NAD-dependent epimerase/dehydratase family protein n=1 Tax=Candidatus Dormiibacter inghamiae TaxID=3127013 RepID=A0A934K9M6_9BACT|nr:NAD-dependent epimerase/dehydratase family protein [Candidatus Dormibacteraeota bacterium]MBJ7604803.1 NAD-dependent epimerase/dehydratase family protein [Candidatus Dormibacteraeota bacterium]
MRCLVLGGTGFVGVAACKELMRRGVETIAASRTAKPYGTFTSHTTLDRRDTVQLAEALGRVRPDVVLDLAAFQAAEVATMLDLFPQGRYVFVSTGVYPDDFGPRAAREEDFGPLPGPVPAESLEYREGKRWCETVLARRPERDWVVIRPPAILGPDDHTLRIAAYIQRVEDGGPLLVPQETFEQQAGLAWVKDVGYACALAVDQRPQLHGPYNVAFDGVSLRALIEALARALGRPAQLVPLPYAELPPYASPYGPDPKRSAGYDLTRARTELGFKPSQLEDALADTLAWYQVQRPSHPGYANRAQELEIAAARG